MSRAVKDAVRGAMEHLVGNPSSDHDLGKEVRKRVEQCRTNLATWLGTQPENIVFTSGATEANNLSLSYGPQGCRSARIVTTPIEHPSVLRVAEKLESEGCKVDLVRVLESGVIDLDHLRALLSDPVDVVSLQWANGETGVVQPIDDIIHLCRDAGARIHIDAAQAVGKLPVNMKNIGPDSFSLSGHKFHAPPGVGALVTSADQSVGSLILGGGQERGRRAGTENWLGIIGLDAAVGDRQDHWGQDMSQMKRLRDRFENETRRRFQFSDIVGVDSKRLPNTSQVAFVGLDGQALVAQLSARGVFCSQSSACSSQRPEPSYVLRAMGCDEDKAYSAVRFSFSPLNTLDEVDWALDMIEECIEALRCFAGGGHEV